MKYGLGIIGYGGMGGWHANMAGKSDVVELVAVHDIKEERNILAEEKGIQAYRTLDEILSDDRIDIITIATPNDVHEELAIKAMSTGKNVISEKPVTLDCEELKEICEEAKRAGKLFTAHQNRRFDCDYLMTRKAYRSGRLGKVTSVESRYQGSRGIPGDWRGKKEHGGGMIYDWGVHLIDQMLGIVDDKKIESVYCRCHHITNDEVDDGFRLELYFEDGLIGHIEVGTTNFISLPRFYITGVNGTGVVNDWRDECRVVVCKSWEDKDVAPVVTSAGFTKTMAPRDEKTTEEFVIPRPESDVHDFYRNFAEAILTNGETPLLVTHEQLMRSMKIMMAAFRSDELGMPIKIEDEAIPRPIR